MTRLSKNFVLSEFTKSNLAVRFGLDNTPTDEVIRNLQNLVDFVLQPIADHFKKPVTISSGYRSPKVNKKAGGADNSQHMKGEAADIEIFGISNYDLAVWIEENLDFDQLILEFWEAKAPDSGWVHVSYVARGKNRRDIRTIGAGISRKGLYS